VWWLFERYHPQTLGEESLWPLRLTLASGLLLFDNLVVLWWYAHRTEQQAQTTLRQFELSEKQFTLAQKQFELARQDWELRTTPSFSVSIEGGKWGQKGDIAVRFRNYASMPVRFLPAEFEYWSAEGIDRRREPVRNPPILELGADEEKQTRFGLQVSMPASPAFLKLIGKLRTLNGREYPFESNEMKWGDWAHPNG
jgi:hypothetical protein